MSQQADYARLAQPAPDEKQSAIGHNQPPPSVPEFEPFVEQLAELRTKYGDVEYDLTDPAVERRARSDRHAIGRVIAALDRTHQRVKAPLLDQTRFLDSERKRIKDAMLEIQSRIKDQIAVKEQREKDRIAALNARMAEIDQLGDLPFGAGTTVIAERLERAGAIVVDESWGERQEDAGVAKEMLRARLESALAEARRQERMRAEHERLRAEHERLRAEAEEREREEVRARAEAEQAAREERLRQEAAEKARREAAEAAERERQEAEDRARREREEAAAKIEAERQAKADAERAAREAEERRQAEAAASARREQEAAERAAREERQRIERERREAEDQQRKAAEAEEKRKARQQYRRQVHTAARDALVAELGLEPAAAAKIVTAIKDGRIAHLQVVY